MQHVNFQVIKLSGYKKDAWFNATTVEEAFCWTWERPAIIFQGKYVNGLEDRRVQEALKYYEKFKNRVVPEGGTTSNGNGDGYTQEYISSSGRIYKEYKQYLGSYASKTYVPYNEPISSAGCSITSIAVVLSGYGINVSPGDLAGDGNLVQKLTSRGLKCEGYKPADRTKMLSGKPMIVNISGTLEAGGNSKHYDAHFIAILDARNGAEVYVSDVGSENIIKIVKAGIFYIE